MIPGSTAPLLAICSTWRLHQRTESAGTLILSFISQEESHACIIAAEQNTRLIPFSRYLPWLPCHQYDGRRSANALLTREKKNKHRSSETGVMLLLKGNHRCSSVGVKSVEERNECLHAQTCSEKLVILTWLTLPCCFLQFGYAHPPDQCRFNLFLLSYIIRI